MSDSGPDSGGPKLIPQPHGGALLSGGVPGNRGGLGNPASEIRARLRGSLAERIKVAEEIADNPEAADADRLRALTFLARFGLGAADDLSVADRRAEQRQLEMRWVGEAIKADPEAREVLKALFRRAYPAPPPRPRLTES